MAGLDTIDSFRFSPLPPHKPFADKENSNPNLNGAKSFKKTRIRAFRAVREDLSAEWGKKRVVIYMTTLRGMRRIFEACNAARAAFEAFGVQICKRDVSMDSGFREELRELLKGKENSEAVVVPPGVFMKGFYIGGAEEILKVAEEGLLGELLPGLPRKTVGVVCEGCWDMRFLPCFRCNGSCKIVINHNHNQK